MPELSVVIVGRNEEFMAKTVEDVLEHARADTEVIAVCDGGWPPGAGIADHPKVQLIYKPVSIGQRAAMNLGARVSGAKYVLKLDAHCSMAEGFDVALITAAETLGKDVTQIPAMTNLWVFDWYCKACNHRHYQGRTPHICPCALVEPENRTCQCESRGPFERIFEWKHRHHKRTESWGFDHLLNFSYFGDYLKRPESNGETFDVMSTIGAYFFLRRDHYFKLGGLDERAGSWGNCGTEVSCKSWLSGGRLVTNRTTHISHLFRTQGGDFGWPYPLPESQIHRTKGYIRDMFMANAWPGQRLPLSWLVDKFMPALSWAEPAGAGTLATIRSSGATFRSKHGHQRTPVAPLQVPAAALVTGPHLLHRPQTAGICYYSSNKGDPDMLDAVREQLRVAAGDLPIVSVTLDPVGLGKNIVLPLEPSYAAMFTQILRGIEELVDCEYVFLVEHDCLYDPSHFTYRPPTRDRYYYDLAWWKVDLAADRAVTFIAKQTSGLCADRDLLITHYRARRKRVELEGFRRVHGFEPGTHGRPERIDDIGSDTWRSAVPMIDIRHASNLTESRWQPSEFSSQQNCRDFQTLAQGAAIPGWGTVDDIRARLKALTGAWRARS